MKVLLKIIDWLILITAICVVVICSILLGFPDFGVGHLRLLKKLIRLESIISIVLMIVSLILLRKTKKAGIITSWISIIICILFVGAAIYLSKLRFFSPNQKLYHYRPTEEFVNLDNYAKFRQQLIQKYGNNSYKIINDAKKANEEKQKYINFQDSFCVIPDYDESFFENKSLILYYYYNSTNVSEIKITNIQNEDGKIIIDLAIAEGKVLSYEKDGEDVCVKENSYLVGVETEKIDDNIEVVFNLKKYDVILESGNVF